nr:MAG TPA: hypothetical protein [Caudoviricetes sp.]
MNLFGICGYFINHGKLIMIYIQLNTFSLLFHIFIFLIYYIPNNIKNLPEYTLR